MSVTSMRDAAEYDAQVTYETMGLSDTPTQWSYSLVVSDEELVKRTIKSDIFFAFQYT